MHPGYLLLEPVQSDPGHPWQLSGVTTPCRAAQGMIPNLDACALSLQHIKLLLLLLDPHLAVNRPKAAPARAVFAALTAAAVPARSQIPPHHGGCAGQAVPGWGNNQGPFCTPRAGQLSLAPAGAGRSTHHSSFNEMLKLHPANTLHA